MDDLLGEFENLKISALSKSKSINKCVHNVTIGPHCSIAKKNKDVPNKHNYEKCKENNTTKPMINNKRTSLGKILTEIEVQVKDEIATSVKTRLEKIQNASKALDARVKSEWMNKQKMLIAQSQQQEDLMMKVLEEHDRKAVNHLQQLQVQQQKQAEERSKRNLELQLKEKYRRELIQTYELIQKQQFTFRNFYQEIVVLLKKCNTPNIMKDPKKFTTISGVSTKLKTYLENMEKIKDVCKTQSLDLSNKVMLNDQIAQCNSVARANLEIACILVTETSKLKDALEEFLAICKEEEKLSLTQVKNIPPTVAQEVPQTTPAISSTETSISNSSNNISTSTTISAQTVSQSEHQTTQKENIPTNKNLTTPLDAFVNRNALKEYANLQQFLENHKKSFVDLMNDTNMKKFRFYCQKAVNIPLNAISAVSSEHMLDKYTKLANLLRGNTVEAGGTTICPSQHPQGIAFCTDLLARQFVHQGDLLISSSTADAEHCYAAVIVALWCDFPNFGRLVLAYFYLQAPYLVPFYPPRLTGQTDREYDESLGYKYEEDGREHRDMFLKRMLGTMKLYAAVTITRMRRGQHGSHPHGLVHAWKWIANVLNMEPRSDVTAVLLHAFLEVAGSSLQTAYTNQFQKLITFINNVYLPKLQEVDRGGPASRLSVFLQKVKKANGQIEPPKGRLPENFW